MDGTLPAPPRRTRCENRFRVSASSDGVSAERSGATRGGRRVAERSDLAPEHRFDPPAHLRRRTACRRSRRRGGTFPSPASAHVAVSPRPRRSSTVRRSSRDARSARRSRRRPSRRRASTCRSRKRSLPLQHEVSEGAVVVVVAAPPEVLRDDLVPRIPFERERVIAVPTPPTQALANAAGRDVVEVRGVISRVSRKFPLTRPQDRRPHGIVEPHVVAGDVAVDLRPDRRDDRVVAGDALEEDLEARAGGLTGLDEHEPVRVRDDHRRDSSAATTRNARRCARARFPGAHGKRPQVLPHPMRIYWYWPHPHRATSALCVSVLRPGDQLVVHANRSRGGRAGRSDIAEYEVDPRSARSAAPRGGRGAGRVRRVLRPIELTVARSRARSRVVRRGFDVAHIGNLTYQTDWLDLRRLRRRVRARVGRARRPPAPQYTAGLDRDDPPPRDVSQCRPAHRAARRVEGGDGRRLRHQSRPGARGAACARRVGDARPVRSRRRRGRGSCSSARCARTRASMY